MRQLLRSVIPALILVTGSFLPATVPAYESGFDPETEVIDLGTASVRFQVRLLGMTRVIGYFDRVIGEFVHNPGWETGSVDMQIDVSSINTNDDSRDELLRGPTFFNAERYPQITFSNSHLVYGEDGLEQISGDLNLYGTTKSVIFDVVFVDTAQGYDAGKLQARVIINRSDFGLNSMTPIISDEVEIIVAMQTN